MLNHTCGKQFVNLSCYMDRIVSIPVAHILKTMETSQRKIVKQSLVLINTPETLTYAKLKILIK